MAGIVRLEVAAHDGLEAALRLADLTSAALPRFAPRPGRDPRAPQNLFPISALENMLRHRLGDAAPSGVRSRSRSTRRCECRMTRKRRASARTETRHRFEFWVGIEDGVYLQLDDVVMVRTDVPAPNLRVSGVVDMVRAHHEGSRFDTDVFLADEGLLPLRPRGQRTSSAPALSRTLRAAAARRPRARAGGAERDEALYFDTMEEKLVAGVARDSLPIYIDLSFLDGRRGAHVNISGISGVATKTTYASFLLYGLFHSQVLGNETANTKALIFNVKGEDLLFLDKPNARLTQADRADYAALGLPAGPFESVGLWAPVKKGATVAVPTPAAASRA